MVENKTGAGGNIGADFVAKADKDGHTLLLIDVSTLAISPNLLASMTYSPTKDLAPVGMILFAPYVLAVHPSVPVKTVAELVAHAKANPGKVPFGNAGIGVANHISARAAREELGRPVQARALSGRRRCHQGHRRGREPGDPQRRDGDRLVRRAGPADGLAVSGDRRVESIKELPTFKELNVTPADVGSWQGLLTTAGTPAPVQRAPQRRTQQDPRHAGYRQAHRGPRRRGEGRPVRGCSPSGSRPTRRATPPSSRKPASRCSRRLAVLHRVDVKELAFGLFLIALALVAFGATSAAQRRHRRRYGAGLRAARAGVGHPGLRRGLLRRPALLKAPAAVPALAWRPLVAILASIALFAVLFSTLG